MSLQDNLAQIAGNIETAKANRAGLPEVLRGTVKLIAVTKNHDAGCVRRAWELGVRTVGENRIQEALSKSEALTDCSLEWHLIGHLQTNKVRQAVPLFAMIHSVDSEKLAREINRVAEKLGKQQKILLEVNVSGEESKFGIMPDSLAPLVRNIAELPNIQICGLMTVAPFYENPENTRPVFRKLRQLFLGLLEEGIPHTDFKWLSMGMTNDYPIAVEEGANMVRIGTGLFGPRQY